MIDRTTGTLSPFMVDGVSLAVCHFVTRLKQENENEEMERRSSNYISGRTNSTG